MDIGCTSHMTGKTKDFLPLKAFQGVTMSFGDGKKGHILCVGQFGNSFESC